MKGKSYGIVCKCGKPADTTLYLHYRRPRENFEPMAVDQWFVHGSAPCRTCGDPGCQADIYNALMAEHPDAEVFVETEPGAGIFVVGEDEVTP